MRLTSSLLICSCLQDANARTQTKGLWEALERSKASAARARENAEVGEEDDESDGHDSNVDHDDGKTDSVDDDDE